MVYSKFTDIIKPGIILIALVSLGYSTIPLWSRVIVSWPDAAKTVARELVDKYGAPDEITSEQLIWWNKEPFVWIKVHSQEVEHDFPEPHKDVLEMAIPYRMPPTRYNKLVEFDGSVVAMRTKGILAASSFNEPMNLLLLNLANDVIRGKKKPDQARKALAEIARGFINGETNPYTDALQFKVMPLEQTQDKDKPLVLKKPKKKKKVEEKKPDKTRTK